MTRNIRKNGRKSRKSRTSRTSRTSRRRSNISRTKSNRKKTRTKQTRSRDKKRTRLGDVRRSKKGQKKRVEVVSDILSSTLGLGEVFKVNEKNYKPQRVAKADVYKDDKPLSKDQIDFLAGIEGTESGQEQGQEQGQEKEQVRRKKSKSKSKSKLNPNAPSFVPEKERKKTKKTKKGPSKYNLFVKKHSPIIRKQNPKLKQPDILKLIAEKWKNDKN